MNCRLNACKWLTHFISRAAFQSSSRVVHKQIFAPFLLDMTQRHPRHTRL